MGEDGRATFTTSMRTGVRILVAGGYGVFGRLLAAELLETTDARLVLAGRNRRQAERAAAELGSERTEAIELDLRDVESVARAAEGCFAIACAAGPFQGLARDLPLAAIRSGAHWLDIADDPGWVLSALGDEDLGEASANAGLVHRAHIGAQVQCVVVQDLGRARGLRREHREVIDQLLPLRGLRPVRGHAPDGGLEASVFA